MSLVTFVCPHGGVNSPLAKEFFDDFLEERSILGVESAYVALSFFMSGRKTPESEYYAPLRNADVVVNCFGKDFDTYIQNVNSTSPLLHYSVLCDPSRESEVFEGILAQLEEAKND